MSSEPNPPARLLRATRSSSSSSSSSSSADERALGGRSQRSVEGKKEVEMMVGGHSADRAPA